MLQPPEKFGIIEPHLYRSAFPTPDSFAHVRLLGLRTVINLSREALTRTTTAFFAEHNVLLVDVGLQVWTHPACEPISHELITEAMRYVFDRSYHPLLVMSSSGTHMVGALVGCLRRVQGWTLSSTLDEYRRYSAPSPRITTEQFIELWDCDLLTLPTNLPEWFESELLRRQAEIAARRAAADGLQLLPSSGSWPNVADADDPGLPNAPGEAPAAPDAPLQPLVDLALMRVDGALVLPGTHTSTIDQED